MIDKRKFYINGTWVNPIIKNDFEVINPSNEKPYSFISLGSKKDVAGTGWRNTPRLVMADGSKRDLA